VLKDSSCGMETRNLVTTPRPEFVLSCIAHGGSQPPSRLCVLSTSHKVTKVELPVVELSFLHPTTLIFKHLPGQAVCVFVPGVFPATGSIIEPLLLLSFDPLCSICSHRDCSTTHLLEDSPGLQHPVDYHEPKQ
jgi:hypothetical protein